MEKHKIPPESLVMDRIVLPPSGTAALGYLHWIYSDNPTVLSFLRDKKALSRKLLMETDEETNRCKWKSVHSKVTWGPEHLIAALKGRESKSLGFHQWIFEKLRKDVAKDTILSEVRAKQDTLPEEVVKFYAEQLPEGELA